MPDVLRFDADASLIRRDSALPGLGVVLNPEAFCDVMSGRFRRRGTPASWPKELWGEITYLRYKPGTNCLAQYQLTNGKDKWIVAAKCFGADQWTTRREAHLRAKRFLGSPGAPILFDDCAVVVSEFPYDPVLKSLHRLATADELRRLWGRVVPDRSDLHSAQMRPLAYKSERRFVGQLAVEGLPQAVVKFHRPNEFSTSRKATNRLRSRGSLRIPARLGFSRRHCVLAHEWIDGAVLHDELVLGRIPAKIDMISAALVELHRQASPRLRQQTSEAAARSLKELAKMLGFLSPSLETQANRLANRMIREIGNGESYSQPIHGDFHARQVVLQNRDAGGPEGQVAAMIDWDEGALGDPAVDLGTFFAHLYRQVIGDHIWPHVAEETWGNLLEAYARLSPDPTVVSRVDLAAAVAMFRIAPHSFRKREANWPDVTAALLDCAEQLLHKHTSTRLAFVAPAASGNCQVGVVSKSAPPLDLQSILADPAFEFLQPALRRPAAQQAFREHLPSIDERFGEWRLTSIRGVRHKYGRRCLIEYEAQHAQGIFTFLGKVRAKGVDERSFNVQTGLRQNGLNELSQTAKTPPTWGMIPQFHMWLQEKIPGAPAAELLIKANGTELASRTAAALHQLHQAPPLTSRRHTLSKEMEILQQGLEKACRDVPCLAHRIRKVYRGCQHLARNFTEGASCGIHRDFYPDQVIVANPHRADDLFLIDFDLYSLGDPLLDVGNFMGHVMELSLRQFSDPHQLNQVAESFLEQYASLYGKKNIHQTVFAYTTLTLTRHIHISRRIPTRRPFTEDLLDLCEQRLSCS